MFLSDFVHQSVERSRMFTVLPCLFVCVRWLELRATSPLSSVKENHILCHLFYSVVQNV